MMTMPVMITKPGNKAAAQSAPAAYMRTALAARYIGVSPGQLKALRLAGKGPRSYKPTPGCVLYSVADLDAFVRSGAAQATTSENGGC
jgi:hypothetical protein